MMLVYESSKYCEIYTILFCLISNEVYMHGVVVCMYICMYIYGVVDYDKAVHVCMYICMYIYGVVG